MPAWSQSHFLQSLGWATLNSFWQMGLLWCLFSAAGYFLKPSPHTKFKGAAYSIFLGFAWFIATAVSYYRNPSSSYSFFENTIGYSDNLLQACLLSASATYLLLLFFPVVRLYKNWRFLLLIEKKGLTKAAPEYRAFVQKVASYLNIRKKVKVVVSCFVSSPLTIGYIKPVILLPVAALNNLQPSQVEAVLLHELAHIRRSDYLVNLLVSVIQTLLYFNPFVKLFVRMVESEREVCCDEMVLQFGYNKVGYAAALLHLEKTAARHPELAMAAAGKKNLITRIEKIVGMEKKNPFRLIQLLPVLAALICMLLFNSVLILKDANKTTGFSYAYEDMFMPLQLGKKSNSGVLPDQKSFQNTNRSAAVSAPVNGLKIEILNGVEDGESGVGPGNPHPDPYVAPANFDDVDGSLSREEKENVKTTVEATKKVLSTVQWKEVETSMAEVLNKKEKAAAKRDYLYQLANVNWDHMEKNLKANYDKLDWSAINSNVVKAMAEVKIDSIETIYGQALTELKKMERELKSSQKSTGLTPMPDASVSQLEMAKETVSQCLDSVKRLRTKKIVHL